MAIKISLDLPIVVSLKLWAHLIQEYTMIAFKVEDMTCGHCASAISQAIAGVDKAARTNVDIQQKLVQVSSTASTAELAEAIREAGYTPHLVKEPAEVSQGSAPKRCCCG